jgi:hypothetical protein
MTPQDGITTLTDAQLEAMLDRSAKRGARAALKEIGLDDDDAGADIHELRTVLTAWRETKRAVWTQVVKALVTLLLAIMALGFWTWLESGRGGNS